MKSSFKQNRASIINELARNGLQPSDPAVREKYEEFIIDVTKQALNILKDRIPAKILYFNTQVNITSAPGHLLHARDLEDFCKLSALEDVENITISEEPLKNAKRQRVDYIEKLRGNTDTTFNVIPVNSQIVKMGERVRQDALELIEMVGVVRLWIQLNVPRIEDGNNFGVAIQEEAIQELGRVEDAAFNLCDGTKYHTNRAKMVSKMLKNPTVEDYMQAVIEVDRKEWIHLKVSVIDMRNSYSMLYDLLHKNWEKVVKPRTMESNSYMVV